MVSIVLWGIKPGYNASDFFSLALPSRYDCPDCQGTQTIYE